MLHSKMCTKGGDGIEVGVKHTLHQRQQSQSPAGQVHIVQKPQHNLQENLQDEEWKHFHNRPRPLGSALVSNQLPEEGGGQQEVCYGVCSSVWVLTIGASVLACTRVLKKQQQKLVSQQNLWR